ncbi:filamentous hemagglutinin outer membrane protein [Calothrix parasitica NIES-267]|uniref:Filamentous hemagglutinin outer membrane protein n=1 Tax=Calothrix parasitica NIES-267 TaxID=1973488 RepID=A0A1Z4LJU5_9CYAN|nr:filamentous hemagglutinin outer membrane protein [Calothrix parasitica NIES-267]
MISKTNIKQLQNFKLLAILSLSVFWTVGLNRNNVFAQNNIVPDETLGNEKSRVVPFEGNSAIDIIQGGAIRDSNLFHSFQEFNVGEGRGAYFFSPNAEIQNILARVTGRNPSEILGVLGTRVFDGSILSTSNANLFLINPNVIVFGENASLDIGGSFVATTANGIEFGEQGVFSASNPEIPRLLNFSPSALFFNAVNNQVGIQNNSIAPAGTDPAGFNAVGLRVADGKSLLLVGGNVSMDGGQLNAYGGRVELGGLAAPGNVNLFEEDNLKLGFPENVTRADVSLTNQAVVSVDADGGGDIAINARNLDILQGSKLFAGIGRGLGTPETVAGDITLNATGEINIADIGSGIGNIVSLDSQGNGGNITLDAGLFNLEDGAQLVASTFGNGNAGNVTVTAKDAVSLIGGNIFSTVEAEGVGSGGNININATTLTLRDGAQLLTSTRGTSDTDGAQLPTLTRETSDTQSVGRGNAGNVNVKVTELVDIAGGKNGFNGGIFSSVGTDTQGNGGNITIDSGSFLLRDGARLNTSTSGKGKAGNVDVRVTDAVSLVDALILSTVEAGGVGKGGNIDIDAATLTLRDGAQLLTLTRPASDTQPAAKGDSGNVNVKVTGSVDIAGEKNGFLSGIFSDVGSRTEGNGGNIEIITSSLSLKDGTLLNASTGGRGNGGNVRVNAKDNVFILGASILTTVVAGGEGQGGDIDIDAANLSLRDGAQLLTATRGGSTSQEGGKGDGGNVNVKVSGSIDIAGVNKNGLASGIINTVDAGAEGNVGNINLDSTFLFLLDSAELNTSFSGSGKGGNIQINTFETAFFDGSLITTTPNFEAIGDGGNIDINANIISLTNGTEISTTTLGIGDAGNIVLKSNSLAANNSQLSTRTFSEGNAGDILIDMTDSILISGSFLDNQGFSGLFSSSNGFGSTGNIVINSPQITLDGGKLNSESFSGDGGNVNLTSDLLLMRRGAEISTNAGIVQQEGDGGNININSKFIVALPQENSDITANAFSGTGGNVEILSEGIFGIEPRAQQTDRSDITASSELGVPGNINLTDPDDSGIRNNLSELPDNQIDTNTIIANSCIVRSNEENGTFLITGSGGLPQNPSDAPLSNYSTGSIRSIPSNSEKSSASTTRHTWKIGDPVIEPQGVYKLPNGQLVLSRECN